ncbi:hypothetical protein [Lactiplantibacillus argentoratensis]|uniref:hypothetical protein n=1 Tax=Lactiplantibacillus argentoratensis TaxID=271881 RepID=UPI001B3417A5|nr:hypothetical protein [Lactiplantibacillus argentoratensis]MBP5807823.1 hypothetical protein [Lactiplantibacillus argentoratensis]
MKIYNYDAITGRYVGIADIVDQAQMNITCQTTVAPPAESSGYKFDIATQMWSDYSKPLSLAEQLAQMAYQQMTTQQTITDLQTQNAQMAYQLMTAQGGATA